MSKLRVARTLAAVGAAIAAAAAGAAGFGAGCTSAPAPVPLRTFERPQKIAVVCLGENASDGGVAESITTQPVGACPPVPFNVNGAPFENHLLALVTQQTRGQLAVVDLTAGAVVDEDHSTPGINFIPVGADPSDVATSPDFDPTLTFVASKDPNSYAVYGIDNTRLLGDSVITGGAVAAPLTLPDLRVCSLPQPPVALGIVTLPSGTPGPAYVVAAVLAPSAGAQATVVSIDPRPFSPAPATGTAPPPLTPGIVSPCTLIGTGIISLAGSSSVPQAWSTAPAWPDGVPYADTSSASDVPPLGPACTASGGDAGVAPLYSASFDAGPSILPFASPTPSSIAVRDDAPIVYVADGALPLIHIVDFSSGAPVETGQLFATRVATPSVPVPIGPIALSPVTSDYRRYLYAVDGTDGSVMVFDATSPAAPATPATPLLRPHPELNPFEPVDRMTFAAPVAALSFATHDWPLLPPNSTNPAAYTGLLCNPNPNALVDGGGAFVDGGLGGYYRPDETAQIPQQGTATTGVTWFPSRLRGVFGFVTLSNGSLVTIDVDDWDAPCRRPDPLADACLGECPWLAGQTGTTLVGYGQSGALALPQPSPGPGDLDPYHAPLTTIPSYLTTGVTEEAFFPVSAPNRARSQYLLRNDPATGEHLPFVVASPELFDLTGAPFASPNGSPLILPTALPSGFIDPSYITNPTVANPLQFTASSLSLQSAIAQDIDAGPVFPSPQGASGVRVSYDDPTAHIDQDWTVTFEGVLPTASDIAADITTDDAYSSWTLKPAPSTADAAVSNGARLCSRGIEDPAAAAARIAQLQADGRLTIDPQQALYTTDYVEITDDLVANTDPYWTTDGANASADGGGPSCWQVAGVASLVGSGGTASSTLANDRYNACYATFGPSGNADTTYARDFPIVRATDNVLEVGRWAWPNGQAETTTNRQIQGPDPSNAPALAFAACCFHSQAHFKVRAGGEWLTSGSASGYLHHVGIDPVTGTCAVRCDDPSLALMNSRAFEVSGGGTCGASPPQDLLGAVGRDSPYAMRNPMLSFVMWNGCGRGVPGEDGGSTLVRTPRDAQWRFSIHGGFTPLNVSVGGPTGVAVSPQSMLYIRPFGQMAIVDGAQQGLVLIDLNTLAFAHTPYY